MKCLVLRIKCQKSKQVKTCWRLQRSSKVNFETESTLKCIILPQVLEIGTLKTKLWIPLNKHSSSLTLLVSVTTSYNILLLGLGHEKDIRYITTSVYCITSHEKDILTLHTQPILYYTSLFFKLMKIKHLPLSFSDSEIKILLRS